VIDDAQAIKLINARREFSVLDVRQPSVGQVIFLISRFFGDLFTSPLDVPRRQAHSDPRCLQLLTGTGSRPAFVHGEHRGRKRVIYR
jgi:hypothetical protein